MRELMFQAMMQAKHAFRRFRSEERGASDMVAVIVLIVIIIAVAAIFREKLVEIVNNVMTDLTDATKQKG